jgi:predicted MFS family arabinose efflux permease
VGFIKRPGAALGILTGLNVLNYLDRYVGAAVLPLIIADLHISDGQAGSLQSIFIFIYALACPIMGILGDRGRRLPLATVGVLIFCMATFGSGLATTFALLLAARSLVGIGEASYAIVTPSVIADLYPAHRRSNALAIFYAAIPVGSALGYMLGGAIGARFGWRAAFFAAGGPGIVLALSLLALAEPPRGRYDAPKAQGSAPLSMGASLRALWARPSFVVNTVAQTVYTFAMGGMAAWIPTYYVRERGLPLDQAAFFFGLCLVLAGFIGTLLGGQVGDRLAKKSPMAPFVASGIALLLSFPFVLVGVLAAQPAIFWPAMFVALLLLFFNTGPLNAAMTNVLPPDLRGRGFAIYSVAIHVLGDGPSPTLIGLASDAVGLRLPVLVAGALLFISGLVLLIGRHTLPRDMAAVAPAAVAA